MKGFNLIFILCLFFNTGSAQEIVWQNTIGGSQNDFVYAIDVCTDGGYIIGGRSSSPISGDKTESSVLNDIWVVKIDSIGNIIWQNTIKGNDNDEIRAISQTSDGGYICGGYTDSNGSYDKSEQCYGGQDYWVIKLNSMGVIEWENTIGSLQDDILESVIQTIDGGYIIAGTSKSSAAVDKSEPSMGGDDYWVVKLDTNGVVQWDNTIGGSANDFMTSIDQTSDGGYICGGHSLSGISGDKTEANMGGNDYWLVKIDGVGNILWQESIGGQNVDHLTKIRETSDGGFVCVGWSNSSASFDKSQNYRGFFDYWVVKTDASGNIQWEKTLGGSGGDLPNDIIQTQDGSFVCMGSSDSNISWEKSENSWGADDNWIVKLDPFGNLLWDNTLGGSTYETGIGIRETADGSFIVGSSSSSGISGDRTENTNGLTDYWIFEITDKYNLIKGTMFVDLNSNGNQDPLESGIPYKRLLEQSSGRTTFSNNNGNYSLSVLDSGNFAVSPAIVPPYYTLVPPVQNITFSGLHLVDSVNNFAFQPTGVYNDLCVTISPITPFRPGFNATYVIDCFNPGTTILNPTVVFYMDSNITFINSNPVASAIYQDSIVFNLGPLNPMNNEWITIEVGTNLTASLGSIINSAASVLPITGDANPQCNFDTFGVTVTGSFDPNQILVNRDTIYDFEVPGTPALDYLIQFQNTGTDTAIFINVVNKLAAGLNQQTFEMLASSHECTLEYRSFDSTMTFHFNNIMLPDSNINEPLSHGYVRYRINTLNSLPIGDSLKSVAAIYFDFNQPVITNTAITEIVSTFSVAEDPQNGINIFPNPSSNKVTVEIEHDLGLINSIMLFDVYGSLISSQKYNRGNKYVTFDLNQLPAGVYFIATDGIHPKRKKLVKN